MPPIGADHLHVGNVDVAGFLLDAAGLLRSAGFDVLGDDVDAFHAHGARLGGRAYYRTLFALVFTCEDDDVVAFFNV